MSPSVYQKGLNTVPLHTHQHLKHERNHCIYVVYVHNDQALGTSSVSISIFYILKIDFVIVISHACNISLFTQA